MASAGSQDTNRVAEWRSIVTLVVFILTNINILFPVHVPVLVPRWALHLWLDVLDAARVIPPRPREERANEDSSGNSKPYVRLSLGLNLVTGPLLASLFLLAIGAVGRDEVHDALIGDDNISPVDIMVFFITLAYIALSIDASGLIRYLAFRVLQWGAKAGHRLFFCLYVFFFLLGSFIGNDPIILSGTAFLAYMTRASSNIVHPRAWIHTQFAVANMASAVLVSSNPTNLVLAGAFKVSFINYTANMIVPVVATAVILYPFLLYTVFADESLIPLSINMHELPDEVKARKPVNPNIPHARGHVQHDSLLSLEETMNPFLDKCGAAVGTVVMAATLVSVLALNAASTARGPYPVFWVTLPAASVMFCWDLGFGWYHRKETRRIARHGRREVELARARRAPQRLVQELETIVPGETEPVDAQSKHIEGQEPGVSDNMDAAASPRMPVSSDNTGDERGLFKGQRDLLTRRYPSSSLAGGPSSLQQRHNEIHPQGFLGPSPLPRDSIGGLERCSPGDIQPTRHSGPATLVSLVEDAFLWSQETFPTATTVVAHLPFALVPFAFCMFVLVQGLVTKGWVPVFAHGWGHWVDKTGTVGSIAGMGFLSVVLCNFTGTNIGTTILLSRVIQAWQAIHRASGAPISDRTFWATVYSMALGVNYGAFSTAFSASLAGLLWRDILARKHIRVRSLEFARVNLPIITVAMIVGCSVLVGQVYVTRGQGAYDA